MMARTRGPRTHGRERALVALIFLAACVATPSSDSLPMSPSGIRTQPEQALLVPGATLEIEARDADGPWGTIKIVRGREVGGYRLVSDYDLDPAATDARAMFFENDPEVFYFELDVTYRADRVPDRFGASDWLLGTASGPQATAIERGGAVQDLAPELSGASASGGTYTLVFPVARSVAHEQLILVYRPGGRLVWQAPVRDPGDPPVAIETIAPPLPVVEGYVEQPDLPISVLFSETADDLLGRPDTCTNPEAGYTVTFPDDWWTNTAVGDVPACSWFSPAFFEVPDPGVVPDGVAIVIHVYATGQVGGWGQALPVPQIESIGGHSARRTEQVGVGGGFSPVGSHEYQYTYWIEGRCCDEREASVIASARTVWQIEDDPAEYILHKAILDRIMASMTVGE
jgi:hypothetical protein